MTAVEALRRARATMRCWMGGIFPTMDGHAVDCEEPMPVLWRHCECASALLDGFSVEEVSVAEHTTDQPHE